MKKTTLFKTAMSFAMLAGLAAPAMADIMSVQTSTSDPAMQNSFSQDNSAMTTSSTTTTNSVATAANVVYRLDPESKSLLIDVNNPTSNSLRFTVPALGISDRVPAMSDRTFYVNRDTLVDSQVVYNLSDADNGTLVSTGTIINPDAQQQMASLDQIINYSTAYSAPASQEPSYHERAVSYQRTTTTTSTQHSVRGMW